MKKLTIDDEFRVRLRELIEKRLHLTQGEFANKIGITAGYLSMVITGKRGPSAEMIAGLFVNYSDYLGWLLTGKKKIELRSDNEKRKFKIFDQAEEWLSEEVRKNPKKEAWFEVEFEETFDGFKKWKEEKEEAETRENYTSSRKVA